MNKYMTLKKFISLNLKKDEKVLSSCAWKSRTILFISLTLVISILTIVYVAIPALLVIYFAHRCTKQNYSYVILTNKRLIILHPPNDGGKVIFYNLDEIEEIEPVKKILSIHTKKGAVYNLNQLSKLDLFVESVNNIIENKQ